MSFNSKASPPGEAAALGKAVFGARSSKRIAPDCFCHVERSRLPRRSFVRRSEDISYCSFARIHKINNERFLDFARKHSFTAKPFSFQLGRRHHADVMIERERQRISRPDFSLVAETDDYAVLDKPPLLLVHPTKPGGPPTLWSELRNLFAFEIANGGQVSIINRLDRETSGLMLIAKTAATARRFGLLMQKQRIAKEYLAIVWEWPEWESKTVDAPIARAGEFAPARIWLKQAIHPRGAPALTRFAVMERFHRGNTRFAIVRAIPQTGRTHQIRVHLASLGHAIVGDKIYGPDEQHYLEFIEHGWTPELERELLLPRHALHSSRLEVDQSESWESALPSDLKNWIAADLPRSGGFQPPIF
jgi:23S rRNA pseudouridine1911/1915/1917 synthase